MNFLRGRANSKAYNVFLPYGLKHLRRSALFSLQANDYRLFMRTSSFVNDRYHLTSSAMSSSLLKASTNGIAYNQRRFLPRRRRIPAIDKEFREFIEKNHMLRTEYQDNQEKETFSVFGEIKGQTERNASKAKTPIEQTSDQQSTVVSDFREYEAFFNKNPHHNVKVKESNKSSALAEVSEESNSMKPCARSHQAAVEKGYRTDNLVTMPTPLPGPIDTPRHRRYAQIKEMEPAQVLLLLEKKHSEMDKVHFALSLKQFHKYYEKIHYLDPAKAEQYVENLKCNPVFRLLRMCIAARSRSYDAEMTYDITRFLHDLGCCHDHHELQLFLQLMKYHIQDLYLDQLVELLRRLHTMPVEPHTYFLRAGIQFLIPTKERHLESLTFGEVLTLLECGHKYFTDEFINKVFRTLSSKLDDYYEYRSSDDLLRLSQVLSKDIYNSVDSSIRVFRAQLWIFVLREAMQVYSASKSDLMNCIKILDLSLKRTGQMAEYEIIDDFIADVLMEVCSHVTAEDMNECIISPRVAIDLQKILHERNLFHPQLMKNIFKALMQQEHIDSSENLPTDELAIYTYMLSEVPLHFYDDMETGELTVFVKKVNNVVYNRGPIEKKRTEREDPISQEFNRLSKSSSIFRVLGQTFRQSDSISEFLLAPLYQLVRAGLVDKCEADHAKRMKAWGTANEAVFRAFWWNGTKSSTALVQENLESVLHAVHGPGARCTPHPMILYRRIYIYTSVDRSRNSNRNDLYIHADFLLRIPERKPIIVLIIESNQIYANTGELKQNCLTILRDFMEKYPNLDLLLIHETHFQKMGSNERFDWLKERISEIQTFQDESHWSTTPTYSTVIGEVTEMNDNFFAKYSPEEEDMDYELFDENYISKLVSPMNRFD